MDNERRKESLDNSFYNEELNRVKVVPTRFYNEENRLEIDIPQQVSFSSVFHDFELPPSFEGAMRNKFLNLLKASFLLIFFFVFKFRYEQAISNEFSR